MTNRDKIAEIISKAEEKCRHTADCKSCSSYGLGTKCLDYLLADEIIANRGYWDAES